MKFDTTLTLLENILTDLNVNWYVGNIIDYLPITYEQNQ